MGLFLQMIYISSFCSLIIFFGWAANKFLGKWYQPAWRYYLWMILGLRLLIPADISVEQAPIRLQTAEIHAGTEISSMVGKEAGNSAAFWYAGKTVWICVFFCVLLYFVFCYQRQWRHLKRFSLPELDQDIRNLWKGMLSKEGIKKEIPVYRSECIYAPMIIGIRKKYLLLPEKDFAREEFIYIFQHEIQHLKYHHIVIKMLTLFLCCVYWYQPMIWLMKREMDRDIEVFCDRKAVQKMNQEDRYGYTQTMISCMTFEQNPYLVISSGFGGTVDVMKERIRLIMKGNGLKKGIGILAVFVMVLGVGSVTVAYGKSENASVAQPEKNQQEETELPENYAENMASDEEAAETELSEVNAEDVASDGEATENELAENYAEDVAFDGEATENEVPEVNAEDVVSDGEATENELAENYAEDVASDGEATENEVPDDSAGEAVNMQVLP